MEKNYSQSYIPTDKKTTENFKAFLLESDTIIIPEQGEPVCSPGLLQKIHGDIEGVQDTLLYRLDDTIYFIYSRYYEGIGEVKVFFDTTPYITSQKIIIKISLVIISIAFFLQLFIGKIISRIFLRDLKNISKKLQDIDMDAYLEKIQCQGPKDDEIYILAETLNKSFQKIETQTKNLKQFITDVSHEFKTPLMSINSKIDVLEKKSLQKELTEIEEKNFYIYLKDHTKKLNTLLETLFLLSRFEENLQKMKTKKIDFSSYLQTKAENILENYSNIEVTYNIKKDVFLEIEDTTCNIIIENILINAIKFWDKNRPIIEVWCDERTFWVSDNGSWISPQQVEKIYDKFYKENMNKKGFWIGLFLVKRIVTLYNWNIEVLSQKQKGTKVIIEFV